MSIRATFFGLEIGRSGLAVSQIGLDVTGHNIANVDTLGYTRQRIITTAYDPNAMQGKIKPLQQALVGGGALIRVHDQIRSAFLDRQFRTEQSLYSYWQARSEGLTFVQSIFEDSEANFALNDTVRNLFVSFLMQTENTVDADPRDIIIKEARILIQQVNTMYRELADLQAGEDLKYVTLVKEINSIAENIAVLNDSIYRYELLSNEYANDLRDKRNLLLDQLSEIADITYSTSSDGQLTVKLNGHDLVNHLAINKLAFRTEENPIKGEDPIHIAYWEDTSDLTTDPLNPVYDDLLVENFKGGALKAARDLRDNSEASSSVQPGIPYYIEQLNNFVRALVQKVNEQHQKGWTYPTADKPSEDGINFFYCVDIEDVTAKDFRLSDEVEADKNNIASSAKGPIDFDPSNPEFIVEGHNENMKAIYNLLNAKDLVLSMTVGGSPVNISIGSFEGFLTSIGDDIFTSLRYTNVNYDTRQTQLIDVDNQRQSISGVSLDEEMTSLIKYTHAYNGAARVITAMDEAIDVIVNRMGRVGL